MWNSRPPPPFMEKTLLNFHFDYLNPSLRRNTFSHLSCIILSNLGPFRSFVKQSQVLSGVSQGSCKDLVPNHKLDFANLNLTRVERHVRYFGR